MTEIEFLNATIQDLNKKASEVHEKWKKMAGVNSQSADNWEPDWQERIADPRIQQLESYKSGLMMGIKLLVDRLIELTPKDKKDE